MASSRRTTACGSKPLERREHSCTGRAADRASKLGKDAENSKQIAPSSATAALFLYSIIHLMRALGASIMPRRPLSAALTTATTIAATGDRRAAAARLERTMTFDRFLAFLAERPDGERWELVDGKPVMNARSSPRTSSSIYGRTGGNMGLAVDPDRPERRPDSGREPQPVSGRHGEAGPYRYPVHARPDRGLRGAVAEQRPAGPHGATCGLSRGSSIEHYVVLHQDRPLAIIHSRANGWEGRDAQPPVRRSTSRLSAF
jgi:hypothetical protein